MLNLVFIMIGSGIGSLCRHGLFVLAQGLSGHDSPFGTLTANLLDAARG